MKSETTEEKWKIQSQQLRARFSFLNDNDFYIDYGMKEVMLNKLQAKLGKTREELNQLLGELLTASESAVKT
jgi:hypothetical protein